jgi:hypothetical protein
MPTPGRLMDTVAEVTGVNRNKVENIYDELRKSGDVPVGVRGRYGITATSLVAAKLLIAVCCAEQVKDAPNAVRRYSGLDASGIRRYPLPKRDELIYPVGQCWKIAAQEFPRLGRLKQHHCLLDALVALIDSYVDDLKHAAQVTISFGSPYPWTEAAVILEKRDDAEWRETVIYSTPQISDEESREDDDPDFLALIDPSKERQRRKFSKLGGDLNITAKISHKTLMAIGELMGEPM